MYHSVHVQRQLLLIWPGVISFSLHPGVGCRTMISQCRVPRCSWTKTSGNLHLRWPGFLRVVVQEGLGVQGWEPMSWRITGESKRVFSRRKINEYVWSVLRMLVEDPEYARYFSHCHPFIAATRLIHFYMTWIFKMHICSFRIAYFSPELHFVFSSTSQCFPSTRKQIDSFL